MLALKVSSEHPHRYRCVALANENDKTILGEQVVLEFEDYNYPGVVSVRIGFMGILGTNLDEIKIVNATMV